MSIKPLTSFVKGLKNKVTNPYFGTLIGVWLVYNYTFVYSVFTFDPDTKLDTRLKLVDKYFKSDVFLSNLLTCIWHALIVLVATYLLLIISRTIVIFFDKRVSLWIYKVIYSKKIKSIEDFNEVVQLGEMAQKGYEEEQKLRLSLQTEYKQLESAYQTELLKNKELKDSAEKNKVEENEREEKIREIIKQDLSKSKLDFGSIPTPVKPDPFEGVDKDKIETLIGDDKLIKVFNEVAIAILKKKPLIDSESYDQLVFLDIVEVVKRESQSIMFGFTTNGRYLRKLLLEIKKHKPRKLFKDD
jgi:hypothetical protein